MKESIVKKVSGTPDWSLIPELSVDQILWTEDTGIRMVQKLCYNEDCIFVYQKAVESQIRAENHEKTDQICEDSCMEFFFSPVEGDQRYFNLEINPLGNLYLGFRKNRKEAARLLLADPALLLDIRTGRTSDGWEVFYRIPVTFISLFFPDYKLSSGMVIRANFYKCGDLTPQPHFLSWNPISSDTPDFHRPEDFGRLVLE